MSAAVFTDIQLGPTPILNDLPPFLSPTDAAEPVDTMESALRHWERLLEQYGRHPFLLVQFATCVRLVSSGQALALLEEAERELAARDIDISPELDHSISSLRAALDAMMQRAWESDSVPYSQRWIPANSLPMPTEHLTPDGHLQVQQEWRELFPPGSELFGKFMRHLAIETNHVENTFLLTLESTHNVICSGTATENVEAAPQSRLQNSRTIASILDDTLAASELLRPLVDDPSALTPEAICEVHRRLMNNARFQGKYIPAGFTRSATRQSVYIQSRPDRWIQCCPPVRVEDELFKICEMAQKFILPGRMSPFALAAWLHLALARCHPFDDGNGRTTRLIASVPLLMHGYPPIAVSLAERSSYFDAINQAYFSDFRPLVKCFVKGMQEGIDMARALNQSA